VEATIFINTTTRRASAAITGEALPVVPVRLLSHLKLNVAFFATGAAAALLPAPTFRVALKDRAAPTASVLWLLSAPTATNAADYEFESSSVDSPALRTLLGDAPRVAAKLEIEWTIAGKLERVSIDVSIENAWIRSADVGPDFLPYQASITALGYLRLVAADGTIYHLGLNTGEPPAS